MKRKWMLSNVLVIVLCLALVGCGGGSSSGTSQGSGSTVTDADGNVYNTVTIGTQTWMAKNLGTTKYNDGTSIPYEDDATEWVNLSGAAYCNYTSSEGLVSSYRTYGRLYNWYAVNTGKLAPAGWHVATSSDWETLISYLTNQGYGYGGSGDDIAKSLASTDGWDTSSVVGTVGNSQSSNNTSGFKAVPCGYRNGSGNFILKGSNSVWWTATRSSNTLPYTRAIESSGSQVIYSTQSKSWGFAVRCVKN